MKILVFSDTHGNFRDMNEAITKHRDCEIIVHCGDGQEQAEDIKLAYPDKMVINVRGNCDWCSQLDTTQYFSLFNKKIMVTHGHCYNVKYTLDNLIAQAKKEHCDIVCFGHTHKATNEYIDGIYVFNPGSCARYIGSYGIIDITPKGDILTNIVKL